MRILLIARTATEALRRNAIRALLTALGIIIGIASVIVMIEIGQGSSSAIQKTIASMGANNILIMPGTAASGGVSFGAGSILTLTAEDSDVLLKEVNGTRTAAPIVRARSQILYGNKNWIPQNIYGSTANYLLARDWTPLAEGQMFTDRDVRSAAKVCIIGQTLVRELFDGASPIGKEIRVENVGLKVVGVLARKGANMMGMDQDDTLIAPWTTIKYRVSNSISSSTSSSSTSSSETQNSNSFYPTSKVELYSDSTSSNDILVKRYANVDQIMISASSSQAIPRVMEQAGQILRERHRLRADQPDDFSMRDMTEMTKALSSTSSLMTRLLLCVAGISLVVGGIGIMNIMLVSVTERTREIGLRMAVGARPKDVMRQFLIEAVILCLSGGIVGIILGRGISLLVRWILAWPTEISMPAIIASFIVSVGVGLIFGYYPAARAARLDPIEALRHE